MPNRRSPRVRARMTNASRSPRRACSTRSLSTLVPLAAPHWGRCPRLLSAHTPRPFNLNMGVEHQRPTDQAADWRRRACCCGPHHKRRSERPFAPFSPRLWRSPQHPMSGTARTVTRVVAPAVTCGAHNNSNEWRSECARRSGVGSQEGDGSLVPSSSWLPTIPVRWSRLIPGPHCRGAARIAARHDRERGMMDP